MSTKKKRSPKKGSAEKARKFTILDKDAFTLEEKPQIMSAGKPRTVSTEEDYQYYSEDFDVTDLSPDKLPCYIIGQSIDDLIHPLDEFTNQVHGNLDGDEGFDIYDEIIDDNSLPTSPLQYKKKEAVAKDTSHTGTDEEIDDNLRQLSSVTFGEEDSDNPNNISRNSRGGRSLSPHRASSQQTVKRVITTPRHRMIVTPARSITSANGSAGRSQFQQNIAGNTNATVNRIPRPPVSVKKSGVKFERDKVSAEPASLISPRSILKADPSLPTVGGSDASKSIAASSISGSKATLPTKGSSTVVTSKWGGASDQGSVFHAQQKWHASELQRQLQVANKRVEDYSRLNEILQEKLDSSNVQLTIDQLNFELTSKNNRIKELQKENQDLKLLSRYQQKELKDQGLGVKEEFDVKMSQEKYIEVLTVHISKLRKRVQECKAMEEKHIEDWEESQSTVRKLRGKITKLKKTIENQKQEISQLTQASKDTEGDETTQNHQTTTMNQQQVDHDLQSVSNRTHHTNASILQDESSLASHLADYVSSKVERRYLVKLQILKKDLEQARHEAEEAVDAKKKLEVELDRRELLVKRQGHELKELKSKYEDLMLQYRQLFHGCELFMKDSAVRHIKQRPSKVAAPPIVEAVPAPSIIPEVAIIEPMTTKVAAKAALLAGDEDDCMIMQVNDTPSDFKIVHEAPSGFFLTGDEVPAESVLDK